jgi:D-xylose transport system substrate-binding protein
VPIVLYDHDAVGGEAEAHVVFDSLLVGRVRRRLRPSAFGATVIQISDLLMRVA